jgi:N-acetyl-anhydromuramyl-L-alanine amidase AmpD
MMYDDFNIKEWLIPVNEWTRPGRKITPKGLVIHWTGNINRGANAKANANFFHNRTGSYGSAHYTLDCDIIYRVIPENEMAYHVGAKKYYTTKFGSYPNNALIGLEICVNMDTNWEKTYDNAVRFAAAICRKYGWKDPWAVLVRHYDVTRKDCPLMWTPFINDKAHVRNSVMSMLKRGKNETAEQYEARIQEGIQWVYSMKANGKLGDEGWKQFVQDVCDAMNGVYKKPAPAPIEERVVYHMSKYFADLGGHWAEKILDDMHEKKLPSGGRLFEGSIDKNGKLVARPNDFATRAELAVMVSRGIEYAIAEVKKELGR